VGTKTSPARFLLHPSIGDFHLSSYLRKKKKEEEKTTTETKSAELKSHRRFCARRAAP